jgi:hypothetical protein
MDATEGADKENKRRINTYPHQFLFFFSSSFSSHQKRVPQKEQKTLVLFSLGAPHAEQHTTSTGAAFLSEGTDPAGGADGTVAAATAAAAAAAAAGVVVAATAAPVIWPENERKNVVRGG